MSRLENLHHDNANLAGRIIISRPVRGRIVNVKKAERLVHGNSTDARFYFDVNERLPSHIVDT